VLPASGWMSSRVDVTALAGDDLGLFAGLSSELGGVEYGAGLETGWDDRGIVGEVAFYQL